MNARSSGLPPDTAFLLERLEKEGFMSRFTMVGGSALALQLGHRQSEDLDFMQDGEKIAPTGIKRFIAKTFPDYRLIREETGYQLDFLVHGVKLTFFSAGAILIQFPVREFAFRSGKINIAPVSIIASLKLAAISQRCTMRDYYDLYYIARHVMPLSEIYANTRRLIPNLSPITYSETIIFTKDIPETEVSDHLLPKEIVTKDQIAAFFVEEIRKMQV